MTLVASRTRIPANGSATSIVTATVIVGGSPVQGRSVAFSVSGVGALSATTANTDANGVATVTLTSAATGGTAVVTATDAADKLTGSIAVAMPALGQIALAAQQSAQFHSTLGVRYSGYQETSVVTFQLTDVTGQPYPAGLTVTFAHGPLGGSYIGAVPSCVAGPPALCSAAGVTDDAGTVSVPLQSGTAAGVVAIAATATAGGITGKFTMGNLSIVGAKANGAHLTVDCSPKNLPALTLQDCSYSHYDGPENQTSCTASFADRFDNVLGVATQVSFFAEAGSVGPPVTSDPTTGNATASIDAYGGTLPWDVAPFGGEYSLAYVDRCTLAGGTTTHNPRDGLVTVIATAYGEEGFVDVNGNGVYDGPSSPALAGTKWATTGEPFIDLGEPYIDANDNGVWDPGEPFIDVNQNGKYDKPNGKWDADTVIWAETRILYSDYALLATAGGQDMLSRFWVTGTPPAGTTLPSPGFSVKGATTGPSSAAVGVVFMDGNLNRPSHLTSFTLASENGFVAPKYFPSPDSFDNIGMSFTQQYCDSATAPTVCSNVCPSAPCYVVTNVGGCNLAGGRTVCSGFGYGNDGEVEITGSCGGTKPSYPDVVDATATLNGVATMVSISGVCAP